MLSITNTAKRLGITRGELLELHWQDLIPWHGTQGLPQFDEQEVEAFRPQLAAALAEARRVRALSRQAAAE